MRQVEPNRRITPFRIVALFSAITAGIFTINAVANPLGDFVAIYDLKSIIETKPQFQGESYPELVARTEEVQQRGLAEQVLPDVVEYFRSPHSYKRVHAFFVIELLGEDACPAISALELISKDQTVREAARIDAQYQVDRLRKLAKQRRPTQRGRSS